jgi:hypothetical protein
MNTMTPHLLSAQHAGEYRLRLRFDDGTEAVVDLASELWGEVFEPLRDPARFREFRVDPELRTLVWPNGADLAPEHLYERACAGR